MMRLENVLFIVFLCIGMSCSSEKNDIFYSYRNQHKFDEFEKFKEKTVQKDSIVIYTYGMKSSRGNIVKTVELPIKGKSKHEYTSDDRKFISTLIQSSALKLGDRQFSIMKYKIDEVASIDEESYIYFNQEIGLIKIQNISWRGIIELAESNVINAEDLWVLNEFIRRNMGKRY